MHVDASTGETLLVNYVGVPEPVRGTYKVVLYKMGADLVRIPIGTATLPFEVCCEPKVRV